jgi:hypothetical protein
MTFSMSSGSVDSLKEPAQEASRQTPAPYRKPRRMPDGDLH